MNRIAIFAGGLILSMFFAGAARAAEKTVTGTLEDSFCYVTLDAHGAGHKKCATECAKKGIPVALVEKGSGDIYTLLPSKNDESMPSDVIDKMEDEVTVTGDQFTKGGVNYLTVKSVK
jgi:hypothetical protein